MVRGGCGVVWLGENESTKQKVAIKQFAKTGDNKTELESCKTEIFINSMLFPSGENNDVQSIAKYISHISGPRDIWLVHEVGGQSLSKHLFEIQGEFLSGQRVYYIKHMPFHEQLKKNHELLKDLLRRVLGALELLEEKGIVHSDLKPDNILIEFNGERIVSLKIIDFGSAFLFSESSRMRMGTLEYLPPECLEHSSSPLCTPVSYTHLTLPTICSV
eukprot:TRINITY_DN14459_c0_g2_i3.p1 TRINITY_DN14459_c0_g2~~TRINITY_DN14459_c0_g2_i3.p1  ORF type:complete len:217 (-),score=44.01 TRINITY_DN14459_c0_g2_i3:47-697(-)